MIESIITGTTCGHACWTAEEDICRCSCAGRNHGCLRTADGVQPARTSKIKGYVYTLAAVGGPELYRQRDTINREAGTYTMPGSAYQFHWHGDEAGCPAKVKMASKSQVERWPELAAFRDKERWREPCYLLWVRRKED